VDVLATLDLGPAPVVLRRAVGDDLTAIVGLLAADQLGATRDGISTAGDLLAYRRAFDAIDSDPAHILVVAQAGGDIAATMQLSFIPGLARRGALRARSRRSTSTTPTAAAAWVAPCSAGQSGKPGGAAAPWSS
jgi:hypothetical protein